MDQNTIIFIKSNLYALNYLVSLFSFFFGISPLLMNRESIQKHNTPFFIEISAVFFLLFNIAMISFDYIANKPLFKTNQCITMKAKYVNNLEFNQYYDVKKLKIIEQGKRTYLLKNTQTNEVFEIPIKDDFRYKYCSISH